MVTASFVAGAMCCVCCRCKYCWCSGNVYAALVQIWKLFFLAGVDTVNVNNDDVGVDKRRQASMIAFSLTLFW